jgi:hypothetical protein
MMHLCHAQVSIDRYADCARQHNTYSVALTRIMGAIVQPLCLLFSDCIRAFSLHESDHVQRSLVPCSVCSLTRESS